MSLNIDVDKVKLVLLADGWHEVESESFDMDAYEFSQAGENVLSGRQVAGVPSTGARWKEKDGHTIVCPVTAILALKY